MKTKLNKPVFEPLSMNEIRPAGWLLEQLKIQAAGLSGNLDRFWPDIRDSQWIGGSAEGWERVPYWLDGFIPLAWLLEDSDMQQRAHRYVNYIIGHQTPDGWICPQAGEDRSRYDVWALFLLLKVLVVYQDATGDPRIQEVVYKALQALDRHLDSITLFNWGHTRWFESLISIWWLYDRTGEDWLAVLATKLYGQGFDWITFFKRWPYRQPESKGRWSFMSHVVNNAMMLKSGALLWRLTGEEAHLKSAEDMVRLLDEYHGMVTGVFTGDECLAGTSPVQGTELCSVAEYMYSLEHLLAITGSAAWVDRLEKIAYNALPATFSPDMWSHQYDQQVNQVQCSRQENPVFLTNGGEANLFGLEPNYGCCTANLSQAWPKLALSTILKSSDGLAAAVYAPCTATTAVGEAQVSLRLETGYPFRDTLHFQVSVDRETDFTLWLRIPQWTDQPVLEIEDEKIEIAARGFYPLRRHWKGEIHFSFHLPMKPSLIARPNGLYAVTRGPLVYSLAPEEKWVRIHEEVPGHEYPHCDYEVYPVSPWNYGLCLDADDPAAGLAFEEKPFGQFPFSPATPPVIARARGRKVAWELQKGSAAPAPDCSRISEEVEEIRLIPYGCTNLRMTEMPLV